jgi:hypothetical protein
MQACFATILELDYEDVPEFVDCFDTMNAMREFCKKHKTQIFVMNMPLQLSFADIMTFMKEQNPNIYYLLFGKTSEGNDHCVVCLNDGIAHNPAWYGNALVSGCSNGYWSIVVFVDEKMIHEDT